MSPNREVEAFGIETEPSGYQSCGKRTRIEPQVMLLSGENMSDYEIAAPEDDDDNYASGGETLEFQDDHFFLLGDPHHQMNPQRHVRVSSPSYLIQSSSNNNNTLIQERESQPQQTSVRQNLIYTFNREEQQPSF